MIGIVQFGYRPEGFWKEIYALISEEDFVPPEGIENVGGREFEMQNLRNDGEEEEDDYDVGEDPVARPLETVERALKDDDEEEKEAEVSYRDDNSGDEKDG